MASTIFLVRHGEAEHNVADILNSMESGGNSHLTDRGRKQIEQVAERLKERGGVDLIVTSPLRRTQETAGIISESIGIPHETDDRLRETSFGSLSGHSAEELWKKYPSLLDRLRTSGQDGVEGFESVAVRVKHFFDENQARFDGKAVAIVSHGDTLSVARGVLLGIGVTQAITEWSPELGSCTEVRWR